MYSQESAVQYNPMLDKGAIAAALGNVQTEARPHERAIRECHNQLSVLEAAIASAESRLAPVLLPVPPEPEGKGGAELRACSSEVVASTMSVSDRIAILAVILGKLMDRVQV